LLAADLNPVGFSDHFFHRGAAITALVIGISHADIMKMGRWKSDIVECYFSSSIDRANLFTLSKQLHSTGSSTPTQECHHLISASSSVSHESIDHSHA